MSEPKTSTPENTLRKESAEADDRRPTASQLRHDAASTSRTTDNPDSSDEQPQQADEESPLLPSTTHPPPPPSGDRGSPKKHEYLCGLTAARFWLLFLQMLVAYFVACFDATIMASSHPVITSYFGSSNSASWLSTAFLLTSTSSKPMVGGISDSIGRRNPYLLMTFIFLLGTVWCSLAGSMTSFILARAACGLGAGGMMTLAIIIVSDVVPIEVRGTYQSYINMTFGVGSMCGAALGGAMADSLGWRWEFGVQVPVIASCLAVAWFVVPKDLGLYGRKRQTLREAMRTYDLLGSALMSASLSAVILGLSMGGNILPCELRLRSPT